MGDDFQINATLYTDNAPTDITGATVTATFQVDGVAKITGHAVTIVSGTAGTVQIQVSAAENVLVAGTCTFDIKVVFLSTQVRHFGPGQFTVRAAIT